VGASAGDTNTSGEHGAFFGTGAGFANTTGNENTLLGFQAGTNSTTGSNLTAVGSSAGVTNLTGSNNTLLGVGADVTVNNLTNATAIGAAAHVSQSNSLVLGSGANVGIGTSTPAARLTVQPATNAEVGLRVTNGVADGTATSGNLVLQTLTGSDSGYSFLGFNGANGPGTEVRYNTSKNRWRVGNDQRSSADVFFIDAYNGTAAATVLAATANGNVGIGGAASAYRLDVAGNLRSNLANGTFQTNNFPPNNSTVLLSTWSGTGGNGPQLRFQGAGSDFIDIGQNGSGDFVVEDSDTPRLTVQSAGNVGIGTTPTARLHVAGTVKIDAANTLEFGAGVSGKEASAGKIGYQTFSADALDIVGAGTTNSNRRIRFYAEGGAIFNGSVTGVGAYNSSDQRLKQDIRPLTNALALVQRLHGRRYQWNALGVQRGGQAHAEQVGVLAQELEQVLPELVNTGPDGYKAVNYAQLTPVLIEAIKELKAENDTLKARTATAEAKAAAAEAATTTDKAQTTATLESLAERLRALEAGGGQARR
jgi:hypothetical protein